MNKKQKKVFLESEADAWHNRNKKVISSKKFYEKDPIVQAFSKIQNSNKLPINASVLEVGSGAGVRLDYLKKKFSIDPKGIDPSKKAVEMANAQGIQTKIGTADDLPFTNEQFDVIIFGFCLYLCDIDDLFKIAFEANRVTRSPGWIILYDFYSRVSTLVDYKHHKDINTHKMDFKNLFSWHPSYTIYSQEIIYHDKKFYTDDKNSFVSLSVLRKN